MICKEKIKTVFVDIDDTIWWFTENSKLSLRHVYDHFGLNEYQPDYEVFRDIYLRKNAELWQLYHYGKIEKDFLVTERFRYTLEQIGVKGDLSATSQAIDEEYLRFLAEQKILVPGAKALLEHLNKHYAVHALSNGFKGIQQRKLESAGIRHLIGKVIISDDCGVTKPLRGIFDYALRECGAEAESSVMIGDNKDADINGAKNAGWSAIYFDLKGAGVSDNADANVSSLEEIAGIL